MTVSAQPTPLRPAAGKRIVLTTFGSFGDVHPYIAIALGLQARGHVAAIATTELYRSKIEELGIGFHAVAPDLPDFKDNLVLMRQVMDQRKGPERIVRDLIMPVVRESYEDLRAAVDGADLLVSHTLTYSARLVAETSGISWVSTMLSPIGFFSSHDPPVLPPAPSLAKLRFLGPRFHAPLFRLLKWTARSWSAPWHHLRAELGLPPTADSPVFDGQHSPQLVLALFSRWLAEKQPDWPSQTQITGFPFYDQHGIHGLPPALTRFLDQGPPPIVFTLGSSAVMDPGAFFEHSVAAARRLNRRAVLLVGIETGNAPASLPDGIIACDYAPFSELFPSAAAIVHQGGVGTTGQAMRAGRPMLVMPYSHDQFDNAARVARLGIARTISRKLYTPARATEELHYLLDDPSYAQRAMDVAARVREEDGVRAACDALVGLLPTNRHAGPP